MPKIHTLVKALKNVNDKEYHTLVKSERLYLNAARKAGNAVLARKMEEYLEEDEGSQEVQYSKKNDLIGGTFPYYNESYSEANQIATRWAHKRIVQDGDRTAIFCHEKWYLVEKQNESIASYRIVATITKKQYQEYIGERKNGIGEKQFLQKEVSDIVANDRKRNSSIGSVLSDDTVSFGNGRKNNSVRQLGAEESRIGETQSDGRRDSKGGGQNREIKYSLSKERIMQQSLMKVLASMKMEMSNKVLIAMKLKKDEQIYRFVKWLQTEVPENQVESRQDEIVNKAIEISK